MAHDSRVSGTLGQHFTCPAPLLPRSLFCLELNNTWRDPHWVRACTAQPGRTLRAPLREFLKSCGRNPETPPGGPRQVEGHTGSGSRGPGARPPPPAASSPGSRRRPLSHPRGPAPPGRERRCLAPSPPPLFCCCCCFPTLAECDLTPFQKSLT